MADDLVPVTDAAHMLGVKPATVYAYVSRGLLDTTRRPGDRRSWLARAEVDAFARRRGARPIAGSSPAPGGEPTTRVGEIDHDVLRYRGRDATELARSLPWERVAELLWTGAPDEPPAATADAARVAAIRALQEAMPATALPLDRLKATTTLLGASDPLRYDLSRPAVLAAARTLAPAFVEALPASCPDPGGDLATRLWARLTGAAPSRAQRKLLSSALVLLAEHGLGPSTRAAREAAATAADPYSVVLAGTSVASGLLLGGGSSLAVQALLGEITSAAEVPRVLGERLLRGDRVSGFGQPRYRGADPRAAALLGLLRGSGGDRERRRIVDAVVGAVQARRGLAPNAEFALGALSFVHGMPRGAGEAVFVVARCAGWIAHAVEVYEGG